jgi:hypothetical protein
MNLKPFVALATAASLSLGGCSGDVDFSDWVATYNKAVDKTQNQNMLLNMVRAAYNQPLEFTTVSVVRGNGSYTGSLSLTGTFPFVNFLAWARSGATLSTTPGISATGGFNFDVASLDNAEFVQGLLTPITTSAINFYVSQGIPRELIFHLMIDRIEISDSNHTDVYVNDPNSPDYPKFVQAISTMLKLGFTTESSSTMVPVGPPLTAQEAKDTQRMESIAKGGLTLQKEGDGANATYQIVRVINAARFCFKGSEAKALNIPVTAQCQGGHGAPSNENPQAAEHNLSVGGGFQGFKGATLVVVSRSTRDVFNYLGNVIYQETAAAKPNIVVMQTPEAKDYDYLNVGDELFVVRKNNTNSDDIVRIEYRGDTYSLANKGHTALVMTIVSQILALSKSINSIPATSAVVVR